MEPNADITKETYNEKLLELVTLRGKDYDKFMEKLYDALTGDLKNVIHDNSDIQKKLGSFDIMIKYFQDREQYEKCAELKKIADGLKVLETAKA